jgi:hypothetical protein
MLLALAAACTESHGDLRHRNQCDWTCGNRFANNGLGLHDVVKFAEDAFHQRFERCSH